MEIQINIVKKNRTLHNYQENEEKGIKRNNVRRLKNGNKCHWY